MAYEKLEDDEARKKEANSIYEKFLVPSAPYLINIDAVTVRNIQNAIKSDSAPPKDLFESARVSILQLLQEDSFQRYVVWLPTSGVLAAELFAESRAPSHRGSFDKTNDPNSPNSPPSRRSSRSLLSTEMVEIRN